MKIDCKNQGELLLSGELTIRRATEIREMLLTLVGQNASMVIRVDEAAEVDPAFLQLLCSAHRTAASVGKRLSLDTGSSSTLLRQLEDAGLFRHIGCQFDCNNNCIWVAAEN
ncbi:MAG TPA: STAS domain-containing protein [Desulfuromonadales bacterium]|nr:STAS domain-containing protein [Desulfuromonadales bacterium]